MNMHDADSDAMDDTWWGEFDPTIDGADETYDDDPTEEFVVSTGQRAEDVRSAANTPARSFMIDSGRTQSGVVSKFAISGRPVDLRLV